jgi:membrane fusion protein (multidrug efflux system)
VQAATYWHVKAFERMDERVDNRRDSGADSELGTFAGRGADTGPGGDKKKAAKGGALRNRRGVLIAVILGGILLAVLAGLWWLNARQYESTDDAFIDARTVQISAQVAAAIVDVPVTDNQLVEAGTVLVRLDDRDFRAQVDQAAAQVAQATANMANIDAQVAAQQARVDQAEKQTAQSQAALTFAQQQEKRYTTLVQKGAGSVEQAQQYVSNLLQAQANYAAAQANAIATQKQLPVLKAQREVAQAQLEQAHAAQERADANLSRTSITAPVAGRVTRLTAAKGNYAAVGQALMMFVPPEVWVTANFKETQLLSVRPGDPVDIRVDTYPHRVFKGHVDSIQAGSGTAFSLLPAENATGNFVKIVQRVPVKIVFDEPPDVLLGPGMSVVPTVRTK